MKTLAYSFAVVTVLLAASAAMADAVDDLSPVFRLVGDDLGVSLGDGQPVDAWTDRVHHVEMTPITPTIRDYYNIYPNNDERPTYIVDGMNGHGVARFDETLHQFLNSENTRIPSYYNEFGQTFVVVGLSDDADNRVLDQSVPQSQAILVVGTAGVDTGLYIIAHLARSSQAVGPGMSGSAD